MKLKPNFLFILLFICAPSWAQEDFDEWRLWVNQTAGYVFDLGKKCEDMPMQCEGSSNVTGTEALNDLVSVNTFMKGKMTEERFFNKAATEQFKFLSCDVNQLSSMVKNTEQSVGLQLDVLDEIAIKLPTLRKLFAKFEPIRKKIADLQISGNVGPGPRDKAHDDLKRKLIDELSAEMGPEVALFNSILSTMWRWDDPLMQDFVLRAVVSDKTPEQFKAEAIRPTANDGLLSRVLGREEFSFREQVLDPMLSQAASDLNHLKRSSMNGAGGGYKPSFMTMDLRKMLVEKSDYSQLLKSSGGSREAAVFMCQLDRRYVSGANAVNMVIGAASGVVMGVGSAKGVMAMTKIVKGLAPESYAGLMTASSTWAVAGLAMGSPVIAEQIKAQCFPGSPKYLLRSGSKICDEKNVDKFDDVQREQLQKENCALAGLVIAASSVPYVPLFAKYGAPALRKHLVKMNFQASAQRKLRASQALNQINAASKAAALAAAAANEGPEIVVIGRRKPGSKPKPKPKK